MIQIAIIEDLADFRTALEVLVNHTPGMKVVGSYSNAEDALVAIPALEPDICLVDINLPGMDGITLVEKLKKLLPKSQFMMCTAYDADEKVFSALKAGAHGYLLKASSPVKIIESLQELQQGGSPMSSDIARRVVMHFQQKPSVELDSLTTREKEILELLAKGFLYKEIAAQLSISIETVRRHLHNIYEKLHVQTRTEAVNKFFSR
ncbi:MAG: response regulator transcription factor [Bacteroidota bacterium]